MPGLVGLEPGLRSECRKGDGDKLREDRLPQELAVMLTGVTAPDGLIGAGVRNVAPNNDDNDIDLSTTGVELAFLGVAGLNPRSGIQNNTTKIKMHKERHYFKLFVVYNAIL